MQINLTSDRIFRAIYVVTRNVGCSAAVARAELEAWEWDTHATIAALRQENIAQAEARLREMAGR